MELWLTWVFHDPDLKFNPLQMDLLQGVPADELAS